MMNSISIDFLKTKKSKGRFVLGTFMLLVSFTYFYLVIFNPVLHWMWLVNAVFFLIMGVGTIMEGIGFSIARIFGNAYVRVDEERLELKPINYRAASIIMWNEINNIKLGVSSIKLFKNNSLVTQLDYSLLTYQQVQDVKSFLTYIAEKKGINIT